MKQFTVYEQASGRILWGGTCPDTDFELQAAGHPGAVVVEGMCSANAGYFVDGVFVAFPAKTGDWAVWDWSAGAWVVDSARAAEAVRARRDALLAGSDWTQGRDIPESVAARWAPYRQALRDLPEQAGFPLDVAWPQAPA